MSYVELICKRLSESKDALREQFNRTAEEGVGVRHFHLDNLLPQELAREIYAAFPAPEKMRLMSSFRELKYTSKNFDEFNPVLKEITFAVQAPEVIRLVEEITGLANQIPDTSLYAGGLSMMAPGHFLNPHLDNSHERGRQYYRTLNLLYYVTPDWQEAYGGNLELWDRKVREHITIPSAFNRLVVMETNPWSWHSVSPVVGSGTRCCVSNYYFSPDSPTGTEYFHVTSFNARPEQTIRRAVSWVDNKVRQGVRALFPQGVGKQDIYRGKGG